MERCCDTALPQLEFVMNQVEEDIFTNNREN